MSNMFNILSGPRWQAEGPCGDNGCEQMSDPKTPRARRLARFELNLTLNAHGRIGDSLRAVATVLHSGLSTGAGGSRVEGDDGHLVATPALHHLLT